MSPRAKRPYSREFTARTDRRVDIRVDAVPPTLKDAATKACREQGFSLRAGVLTLLRKLVNGEVRLTE